MNTTRGPLFYLKSLTHQNGVVTTLLDHRTAANLSRLKHFALRLDNSGTVSTVAEANARSMRVVQFDADGKLIVINDIAEWREFGFEFNSSSRELLCHSEDTTTWNTIRSTCFGLVDEYTVVDRGPLIECFDLDTAESDRIRLLTIILQIYPPQALQPKYYFLGHTTEDECDRWVRAFESVIEAKRQLMSGWRSFMSRHMVGDLKKAEEWQKLKEGRLTTQLNAKATLCARMKNGKVLHDIPRVLERFGERIKREQYFDDPTEFFLDLSQLVPALTTLGFEVSEKQAARMLEELKTATSRTKLPGKLDSDGFRAVVETMRNEMLLPPSDEVKNNLVTIMQDSRNPFLRLLSAAEKNYLIEGKDKSGHNVCICKTFSKGTVLVRQNDEGDSMFLIIEGSLSVIVAFGSGSAMLEKEVAVLSAGAVMGEMSLVLGKPRSATCIVKSDVASVAEITHSAVVELMRSRPSIGRELLDLVHRRDASNIVAAERFVAHKVLRYATPSAPPPPLDRSSSSRARTRGGSDSSPLARSKSVGAAVGLGGGRPGGGGPGGGGPGGGPGLERLPLLDAPPNPPLRRFESRRPSTKHFGTTCPVIVMSPASSGGYASDLSPPYDGRRMQRHSSLGFSTPDRSPKQGRWHKHSGSAMFLAD